MCVYLARVLPPPRIKYRDQGNREVAENVTVGKWSIRNRFSTSPIIDKWGMIYFSSVKPNQGIISILQEFERELPSVSYILIFCQSNYHIESLDIISIRNYVQIESSDNG